jgi:excisionase family DNA binding protein
MRITPEQIEVAQRRTYVSIAEVAAITGLSSAYWRARVHRREIRVIKAGRAVRIARADLNEFLSARRREARAGDTGGVR